ncbi:hypothetical protein ACLB2K_012690 [Fragaria x ananassa]
MFTKLKGQIQGLTTQISATKQNVADLSEHVKQDRALWKANHDKLTMLSKDHGHLDDQFTETTGLVEGFLQRTQQELGQTTNILHKKIELPSSQSNDEDVSLDEPTSKEETSLSINDKEPKVEAGEALDNNLISKTDGVPQKDKLEGRTKQSTLEKESGSNTDGELQLRMRGDQIASFLMRDVYVDTGQPHGGQGGARLPSLFNLHDQGHDFA